VSSAPRNILLINGHPDPRPERLCAALADAYAGGAIAAGRQVRRVDVGSLAFPLIGSKEDFLAEPAAQIREIQEALTAADHIVIVMPLWIGSAPARLKGLLEQVFRYGVALTLPGEPVRGLLKGKSARIVVTMGMPALAFRWVFGAHGLKSLERGLLWISGVKPVSSLVLGGVESADAKRRARWLAQVRRLGAAGR